MIVALLVVILAVATVSWSFFKVGTSTTARQASKTRSEPEVKKDELPIALSNKSIREANVTYVVRVKVREVKESTLGKELVTSNSNLPTFLISGSTKIFYSADNTTKEGSFSDLVPEKSVLVRAVYDLKKKEWTVERITILAEDSSK